MSGQVAEPRVEVVMPVFNGAPHLRECIESVIGQTHRNWTYTIIDNCSDDDSALIAQEYADVDPRIRVVACREFVPIIDNHNRAMDAVTDAAEFVKPLMADDRLYPHCISRMLEAARQDPRIGLVCCYANDGEKDVWTGFTYPEGRVAGKDAARVGLLGDDYFFGTPSSMMLRADLVRGKKPFFNPANWHADQESGFDLLRVCDFSFVHEVLLFNRFHEKSWTSAIERLDSVMVGCVYAVYEYGRHYLLAEEYERRCKKMFDWYHGTMARAAAEGRPAEYWDFHQRKLAIMGRQFRNEQGHITISPVGLVGAIS